jgi:superfamily II DNA or RNA helicase
MLSTDPMKYGKGYPCLYGLTQSANYAIKRNGVYEEVMKNGTSWHIANRKSAAVTYFASCPVFTYVIVLSQDIFKDPTDLYLLDADFVEFLKNNKLGQYHLSEGGGHEWFSCDCPQSYLQLRLAFLETKGLTPLAILTEDPFPIRDLTEEEELQIQKEDHKIKEKRETQQIETLYEKFCRIFLPGKVPRRIQQELWAAFSQITSRQENFKYKGIVQWPTGCGKTIAILMMIVIAKEYAVKKGIYYRCLLISPKNDIFDTIAAHFNKLSAFGIRIYDGSNAKFSNLTVSSNEHCLVMACHSALLYEKEIQSLPPMLHIHYDEVHRITGDMLFALLKDRMLSWSTTFLTGTSATPKTSSPEQHRKLAELFGDPLTILHKCDVDEAVKEGWIAKPRFHIRVLEKHEDRGAVLDVFVKCAVDLVLQKNKGGKHIFYIESSIEDVRYAVETARKMYPSLKFYAAIDTERTDDLFLSSPVDFTPHILFACQRYREGSDIPGLEITGKLVGEKTAAHNLIQISGRGLRMDYPDKEGWCLIARPSDPGTTVEDVLDSILLEILDYLGKETKMLEPKEVHTIVKQYFGELSIEGSRCSLKETVERIQAAYLRIQFARRSPKERYVIIQSHNKELGLTSKYEYYASRCSHPRFIEDPSIYFKDCWISWYDFLGMQTSCFPQTKADFHGVCKERGIHSWSEYKSKKFMDLPENPGDLYSDWTNPHKEFAVDDEIVW